jgi:hypothetical protein
MKHDSIWRSPMVFSSGPSAWLRHFLVPNATNGFFFLMMCCASPVACYFSCSTLVDAPKAKGQLGLK